MHDNSNKENGRGASEAEASAPSEEQRWPLAKLSPHPRAELVPALPPGQYEVFRADIAARGLHVPLDVTSAGVVLDGHQRLRAAGELGLRDLPVRVLAPADEVVYIVQAALQRRQLNAGQRVALVLELHDYEQAKAEARARSLANLRQNSEVATLPARGERTRDPFAKKAGASARTVEDVALVKAESPELFEQIKAGLTSAEKAARQVRQRRRAAHAGSAPPLPAGRFQLIYADPPWQLGSKNSSRAVENHYPTMPLEEIEALAVPAAEDAVLFLWAVACRLPEALRVLTAWGFEYKTHFVWVKDHAGLGFWVRHRHELLLIGRKGNFPVPAEADRPDSVIEAKRSRHSEKPDCVYERLERMYPWASKLELFARGQARPGWTAWGNEATP